MEERGRSCIIYITEVAPDPANQLHLYVSTSLPLSKLNLSNNNVASWETLLLFPCEFLQISIWGIENSRVFRMIGGSVWCL